MKYNQQIIYLILFTIIGFTSCNRGSTLTSKYSRIDNFFKTLNKGDIDEIDNKLVCNVEHPNPNALQIVQQIILEKGVPSQVKYKVASNKSVGANIFSSEIFVNLIDSTDHDKKYVYAFVEFYFHDGLCGGKIQSYLVNYIPREWSLPEK